MAARAARQADGYAPRAYAFADKVRLRFPLAFFNTGAKDLIVNDLRLVSDTAPSPLDWITTRTQLQPKPDDGHALATPFSVQGRATSELIVEFGEEHLWSPAPASEHRLVLQAQVHPSEEWMDVVAFTWWTPPAAETMSQYIAYRNVPGDTPADPQSGAQPQRS